METYKELKLTDYGTVVVDNKEIRWDTFKEHIINGDGCFNNYPCRYSLDDFIYNKEKGSFDISFFQRNPYRKETEHYTYSLILSDTQRDLLAQGGTSPELLKIIAFSEECSYKKRQRQIDKDFYKTGKLPTDPEELVIYTDLLQQELAKSNAVIIKNSLITSIIPVVFGASFIFFIQTKIGVDPNLLKYALSSGLISFGVLVLFVMAEKNPFPIDKIREELEQKGIIRDKINYLNRSKEKRDAIEAEKSLSFEGLENKEIHNASENGACFLKEVEEIKKKIAMLPEEERNQYFGELVEIVRDYYTKVSAILDRDNNKIVLGDAANLWSVTASMLPELFTLEGRIDQRLSTLKEKQELKSALEQIVDAVEPVATERGYTDGWSDDLTSGGVAYATIENETNARRMA